jgi:hypothetical protein
MKRLLLLTAAFAALSLTPASAAGTIDLFATTASTDNLTLVLAPPPGNQPQNNPCLICGTNQPGQPANFGFNNYKQSGNESAFVEFSSATVGAQLNQDQLGTGYDLSFLKAFLLSQTATQFNVGIDVNTAQGAGAEILVNFAILDLTQHTILSQFNGPVALPTFNNGSGFPDYLLTGFNIDRNDIALGDQLIFYASWANASDGAESFFLVPANVGAVPEPATWGMMLLGFLGLGAAFRMKRRIVGLA